MANRNLQRGGVEWGLTVLAVGIVVAAILLGNAAVRVKQAGGTIGVTGSAKRPIVSDLIVWKGEVAVQMPTMQETYAKIKRHTKIFQDFVAEYTTAEDEISYGALQTDAIDEYDPETRRPTGRTAAYRMRQPFEIRSTRVDSVAEMIVKAGDLVNENLVIWSRPPEYLFTKLPEMRIEMLGEATKDATERARKIAETSGAKLGSVRDARMGVFQITPRHSTRVTDYGIYDTSTKEKDITAVVRLSFALK